MATILATVGALYVAGPYPAGGAAVPQIVSDGTNLSLEPWDVGSVALSPYQGFLGFSGVLVNGPGGLLVSQNGFTVENVLDSGTGTGNAALVGTLRVQGAATLWSGTGAPTFAATVGDLYVRTDGGGTAKQNLYTCTVATGTWVGIA